MIALLNPLELGTPPFPTTRHSTSSKICQSKWSNGKFSKEIVLPGTTKLPVILGFSQKGNDGNYSSEYAQVVVRNLTTLGLVNV